jgi:murein DD-endopeptidase MepM/ murein hydrolase activator NlpD
MKALDRLLTIIVTATLTSAAWILFGSAYTSAWRGEPAEDRAAADRVAAAPIGEAVADSLETPAIVEPDAAAVDALMIPVAGVRRAQLSDTFTDERGGGARLHEALDIMAPRGTRVVAAAPGKVESLFQSDAGGNTIYVRSNDRQTIYYYAHLDAYAQGLNEGDTVRSGQTLGTVGSSGNASPEGPHLHFVILRTTPDAAWWEPATAINPYPLLAGG